MANYCKCTPTPRCVCCVVGILCGTIAAKKKKKMMYLTAKNAGEKMPEKHFILISLYHCLKILITRVNRV